MFVFFLWWCSEGSLNSLEYKSSGIFAVPIEISLTEYHYLINNLNMVYSNTVVYGGKLVW